MGRPPKYATAEARDKAERQRKINYKKRQSEAKFASTNSSSASGANLQLAVTAAATNPLPSLLRSLTLQPTATSSAVPNLNRSPSRPRTRSQSVNTPEISPRRSARLSSLESHPGIDRSTWSHISNHDRNIPVIPKEIAEEEAEYEISNHNILGIPDNDNILGDSFNNDNDRHYFTVSSNIHESPPSTLLPFHASSTFEVVIPVRPFPLDYPLLNVTRHRSPSTSASSPLSTLESANPEPENTDHQIADESLESLEARLLPGKLLDYLCLSPASCSPRAHQRAYIKQEKNRTEVDDDGSPYLSIQDIVDQHGCPVDVLHRHGITPPTNKARKAWRMKYGEEYPADRSVPKEEMLLEKSTTEQRARLYCGTSDKNAPNLFIPFQAPSPPDAPKNGRLYFDTDSVFIYPTSPAVAKNGLDLNLGQQPTGEFTSSLAFPKTRAFHRAHDGSKPTTHHVHLHQHTQWQMGRLAEWHDLTLTVIFPALFRPKRGTRHSIHLRESDFRLWMDGLLLPALRRRATPAQLHHLPVNFDQCKHMVTAGGVEGRQRQTSTSRQQRLTFRIAAADLAVIWTEIMDQVQDDPRYARFEGFWLFLHGKNLKLSTQASTLEGMERKWNALRDRHLDPACLGDREYRDFGVEVLPLRAADEPPITLLPKTDCLRRSIGKLTGPSTAQDTFTLYPCHMLRDVSTMQCVPDPKSLLHRQGVLFLQRYAVDKESTTAGTRHPFAHQPQIEGLAVDPRILEAWAYHGRNARTATHAESEPGYSHAKMRCDIATDPDREDIDRGERSEVRCHASIFQEIMRVARERGVYHTEQRVHCDCLVRITTRDLKRWQRYNINKFCYGFEALYRHWTVPKPVDIPWEATKLMLAFLRCLPWAVGGGWAREYPACWFNTRDASKASKTVTREVFRSRTSGGREEGEVTEEDGDEIETAEINHTHPASERGSEDEDENPDTRPRRRRPNAPRANNPLFTRRKPTNIRLGLGFEETIRTRGYAWWLPRIDWSGHGMRFRPEVTHQIAFDAPAVRSNSHGVHQSEVQKIQEDWIWIDRLGCLLRERRAQPRCRSFILDLLRQWVLSEFRRCVWEALLKAKLVREEHHATIAKGDQNQRNDFPLCWRYYQRYLKETPVAASGNTLVMDTPDRMVECLFGDSEGWTVPDPKHPDRSKHLQYDRSAWKHSRFRKYHQRCVRAIATALSPAEAESWQTSFKHSFYRTHWVLPLPGRKGKGLVQSSEGAMCVFTMCHPGVMAYYQLHPPPSNLDLPSTTMDRYPTDGWVGGGYDTLMKYSIQPEQNLLLYSRLDPGDDHFVKYLTLLTDAAAPSPLDIVPGMHVADASHFSTGMIQRGRGLASILAKQHLNLLKPKKGRGRPRKKP